MTAIRVVLSQSVVRVTQADGTQVRVNNTRGAAVRVSNIGLQGIPGPRLVEIVYQISGIVPPSRTITGYLASADITFVPADAVAVAGSGNSSDTSITITDLTGSVLGSVDFLANAVTGTVTISAVTLHKGQGLKFVHSSTVTTLADLVVTLSANRGG